MVTGSILLQVVLCTMTTFVPANELYVSRRTLLRNQ